jgi:anti-anti-sigma factor
VFDIPEYTCPVQWTGRLAVVTLPECIDRSNADQIREQLLLIINRGAVVLIADLAATVSCDYSGTNALVRAYQRAAANGTDLRLVVIADVVRRVLRLSGLDRLVSIYPTLEAAVAAGAGCGEVPGTAAAAGAAPAVSERAELDRVRDLLDWAVSTIFTTGMSLQAAIDLPGDLLAQRITDALGRLDEVIGEVRHDVFADRGAQVQPGRRWRRPPDLDEQFERTATRTALLHQRVVHTARAVQSAAADTAALLQQRAGLLGEPRRIDYPTETKRWQILADDAAQLAERWEQRL